MAIIAASIFTDWLDGYTARRFNAVSVAGKLLDPFADALFCMIVFVVLAGKYDVPTGQRLLPVWVVAVLIGREALVTFLLRPLALAKRVVIAARMLGKVKTGFQFGLMITVMVAAMSYEDMWIVFEGLNWLARHLRVFGYLVVVFLSVTSFGFYCYDVAQALKRPRATA